MYPLALFARALGSFARLHGGADERRLIRGAHQQVARGSRREALLEFAFRLLPFHFCLAPDCFGRRLIGWRKVRSARKKFKRAEQLSLRLAQRHRRASRLAEQRAKVLSRRALLTEVRRC